MRIAWYLLIVNAPEFREQTVVKSDVFPLATTRVETVRISYRVDNKGVIRYNRHRENVDGEGI